MDEIEKFPGTNHPSHMVEDMIEEVQRLPVTLTDFHGKRITVGRFKDRDARELAVLILDRIFPDLAGPEDGR